MRWSIPAAIPFALLTLHPVFAQEHVPSEAIHDITSSTNGLVYRLFVETPPGLDQGNCAEVPMLYLTDGNMDYDLVKAVTDGERAMGGDVAPGRSYLVGEHGPEVLRMGRRGGSIIPNHNMGGGGGGNVYLDGQLVGRVVDERLGKMLNASRVGSYYRSN